MDDNIKGRNQVIKDALHRGLIGGTSGAMAMTIQVSKQSDEIKQKEIIKVLLKMQKSKNV